MNPEDISKFIHGCDVANFKNEDYDGHVGVVMMHHFLSKGEIDVDRFSRDFKIDRNISYDVFDRFNANGLFNDYSWTVKSRNALLSILKHKDKGIVKDWCHIAAVASGFLGKA
jgi:hypothetical protein